MRVCEAGEEAVMKKEYRLAVGSSFNMGYVCIQQLVRILGIPLFYDSFHKIYFDDGDCEMAFRKARKMMSQLEKGTPDAED